MLPILVQSPAPLSTPCPYLAVHLRRRDFTRARPSSTPSIEGAARQLSELAAKLGLKKVFVASDAPQEGKT